VVFVKKRLGAECKAGSVCDVHVADDVADFEDEDATGVPIVKSE
jgi:hypothetical protein